MKPASQRFLFLFALTWADQILYPAGNESDRALVQCEPQSSWFKCPCICAFTGGLWHTTVPPLHGDNNTCPTLQGNYTDYWDNVCEVLSKCLLLSYPQHSYRSLLSGSWFRWQADWRKICNSIFFFLPFCLSYNWNVQNITMSSSYAHDFEHFSLGLRLRMTSCLRPPLLKKW